MVATAPFSPISALIDFPLSIRDNHEQIEANALEQFCDLGKICLIQAVRLRNRIMFVSSTFL